MTWKMEDRRNKLFPANQNRVPNIYRGLAWATIALIVLGWFGGILYLISLI